MRSEIFLDEALKDAKEKGLIKGPDINLERVQRGIEKLTGSVRKRVLRVFDVLSFRMHKHPLRTATAMLSLAGAVAGCTFDVTGLDGLKFPDAQADGVDTGGDDGTINPGDARGDAEIGVNPLDTGDLEDVLGDLELHVPDGKDAEKDDGKELVDVDVGDEGDAGDDADVGDEGDMGGDTDTGDDTDIKNPDTEVSDPCAGVDCDDKDPCTDDECEKATGDCGNTPKPLTNDGDKCTTESCDPLTGETVHTPVDPDDGDPCTDDNCDPATGKKTNTPKDVDDKDPCTDDLCDPVTGEPINTDKDCGDDNPFTTDACNPATGDCTHVPPVCDDGDPCTKDGYDPLKGCSNEPVDCEDGDACTEGDACNSDSGKCESTPKDCGDGDECTKNICLSPDGDCVNPPKPIENDGNPCTTDGCDPATGLATHDVEPCDDGSACTNADACDPVDGKCKGEAVDCDDGDACTGDSCDPAEGCKHTPANTDDGNACTTDSCDKTTGNVTHTPVSVDDGNACTTDNCNSQTGAITHTQIDCDDGITCTVDACAGGFCVSTPIDQICETLSQCATPTCDGELGCVDVPLTGIPCDNGDGCDTGEKCEDGGCGKGAPKSVDDADACTIDSCVSPVGTVLHEPKDCGEDPHVGCFEGACLATSDCVSTNPYTIKIVGSGALSLTTYKNGTATTTGYNPNMDAFLVCGCTDVCAVSVKKHQMSFFKVYILSSDEDPYTKITKSTECFTGEVEGEGISDATVVQYFDGNVNYGKSFETDANEAWQCESFFGPVKEK